MSATDARIAGICVVRDRRDILPHLCGHYLRLGFDRLAFVDDGSTDGTYEFLSRLSRRDGRVTVARVDAPMFLQREHMTQLANGLIAEGIRTIFPFDSDEFWNIEPRAIRRAAEAHISGLFVAEVRNFVQHCSARRSSLLGPLRATHRAPALVNNRKQAADLGKPRMCFVKEKVAFKSSKPVDIESGQHFLLAGPKKRLASNLEVFHLYLQSADGIEQRRKELPRFPRLRHSAGGAWRDRDLVGRWSTNSADDDGCITGEDGELVVLIPDRRLRGLLRQALIYMAVRHPVMLLREAWRRSVARSPVAVKAAAPGPLGSTAGLDLHTHSRPDSAVS